MLHREEWKDMHISNIPSSNVDRVTTGYRTAATDVKRSESGYALDISLVVTDNAAYGLFEDQGVHGRTAEEVMQAAGSMDVSLYRDYMTVMSNSMSDEDFAKLMEDGCNPTDIDIETAVTIVDTIKAQLIKAGVDIVGYTDSIDKDVLVQITGSESMADSLLSAFSKEDVPVTQENVSQAVEAYNRGQELTELPEGAVKYMVTNGMEPEIDNLYLAEHAGAKDAGRQKSGYFREELPGYYGQKAADADMEKLQNQIGKVIEKAGFPITDETMKDGIWLVEKGIPLTEKSFCLMEEIKEVTLPASGDKLLEAIAGALAEGRKAGEGNLADGRSVYRKAVDCFEEYERKYKSVLEAKPFPENIKARRQLEEIRLHMTVEANVKLLKSGFSIDTAPMEEMINALKELEGKQAESVSSVLNPADLCRETVQKTRELPYLPSSTLGRMLSLGQILTVDAIYETGQALRDAYRQAGEAYETMMTIPRADMGDNIKKAFQNVDALLENMGQELTEENRKAVRSLSYNHMELTEENLLAVKEAEKTVTSVVKKMTPPAVLDLIRKGINPLKTSMEELSEYLSGRDDFSQESEKYSRFLYNLEQNKEITADEKESFIGIYRLLKQIEKSDGAVIGSLVNSQAEINFSNLLSVVRSGKIKGINISMNDNFGSLKEAVERGVSIDTQIEAAYNQTILEEIRKVNEVSDEAVRMLQNLEQPVTIDNLFAADAMRRKDARSFKMLAEAEEKAAEGPHLNKESLTDILEDTGFMEEDTVYADKESFQDAYAELMERSESMAKALTFETGMESLDVRALQLVCKQLHLQKMQAVKEQEYELPQMIDGDLTAIHLKLVHSDEDSGKVFVGVDTAGYGYLSGEFFMESGNVSGYFTGSGNDVTKLLHRTVDALSSRLRESGLKPGNLQVIDGNSVDGTQGSSKPETETRELYNVAGMVIGALKQALSSPLTVV